MNTNKLQRRIRAAVVAFSLVFGIGILSTVTASAQNRDNRRDDQQNNRRDDRDNNDRDYNNRNNDNDRYDDNRNDRYDNNDRNNNGFQQAYRAGFGKGMEDARDGRRANAQRAAGQAMRQWNNNSRWGNQNNMRQNFREAFIRGYMEGYNRYDNRRDRRNDRNRRYDY